MREYFENVVKERWLKSIDRAVDSYHKAQHKAYVKHRVLMALVDRYNEIYDENLGSGELQAKEKGNA